ncbi:MAG: glycosyltransferase family 9 protein [Candidatus Sumerlaeia bacterium]|nr:glycosyltransferase family 9 protein [Candidatus Sumerlaeia bacterium]
MLQASVVILTAPRPAMLERCLDSLTRLTVAPAEVIVVHPATARAQLLPLFDRFNDQLRISPMETKGGSYAEARNVGTQSASGEAVAFIDDDCQADPKWLEYLLPALDGAVAVGGSVLPARPMPAPEGYCPELAWAAGLTTPGFLGPAGGREALPAAANLAFRADIAEKYPFQTLGGDFAGSDDDYELGREDAEWWRRLRRAGEVVAVQPRAIVWHDISDSRLNLEAIRERAHRDGRAFWRRERSVHAVPGAAADVIATCQRAVSGALAPHIDPAQAWAANSIWAERQLAFLGAAVDDPNGTVSPTERTRAFVAQGAAQLGGLAKAAARPVLASLYHALKEDRANLFDSPPKRLLVVLHPFLGDAVLALPMLEQLAAFYPDIERTLLTSETNLPLLQDQQLGYNIVPVPANAKGHGPGAVSRLRSLVRRISPDLVFLTYMHGISPIPFMTCGAVTIGWTQDNGANQRLWPQLLTVPVEKRLDQHETVALLNLLAPVGIKPRYQHPRLIPSDRTVERAREALGRFGIRPKSYVVLHVENQREPKYWSPEGFAHVASEIQSKTDYVVVLEGSRSGRAAAEKVKKEVPSCVLMHGALNTAELAVLLSEAVAFLGSDSGPAHVAAAVGCPSLVLFGPSPVHRWGPLPEYDGSPGRDPRRVLAPPRTDFTDEERAQVGQRAAITLLKPEEVAAEFLGLIAGTEKKS